MKAIWNGQVIAEADKDDLIYIERNWYFPPSSLKIPIKSDAEPRGSQDHEHAEVPHFRLSPTPYHCPWKGDCQYYDVCAGEMCSHDTAWTYPDLKPTAIELVGQDFTNYVAFWHDVQIVES